MSTTLLLLLAGALGYLIGAIPFGYLVARARGVDITTAGSGNIGATNVGRVLGRKYGLLVFFLDFAKGALPVLAALHFTDRVTDEMAPVPPATVAVTVGVAAFFGHLFPIYLRFRGGKGVATGFGVVAVLLPGPTALAFAVWVLVVLCTRYVSLASLAAALTLVVGRLILEPAPWPGSTGLLTKLSAVAALMIVLRHRANIVRLWRGAENRLEEKPRMAHLVKVAHVLSVGLWFGMVVFFTFVVGLSLFATFERLSVDEPRPIWLPLPPEFTGPTPGPRFPDPLRKEQGSRIAGAAVGPMFAPYFLLQSACAVVALVTALSWWKRGRPHRTRAVVLALAFAGVGVGWWLERKVEQLRVERSRWSDAVLTNSEPRAVALSEATQAREQFGRWHSYSLMANFATLAFVTVAMTLAASLPTGPARSDDSIAETAGNSPRFVQ